MTMTDDNTETKEGKVLAIAGPVVDVEFPRGSLPEINTFVEMDAELEGEKVTIGGEVAQQITKWVQDALHQKVQEQPHQLIVKLNAKIEQNHDELRLSLVEAMQSKWMRQSAAFLPESVQTALRDQ